MQGMQAVREVAMPVSVAPVANSAVDPVVVVEMAQGLARVVVKIGMAVAVAASEALWALP